jgi:hypothetical protein
VAGENIDANGHFTAEVECFYSRRHGGDQTWHFGPRRTDAGDVVRWEPSGVPGGAIPLNRGIGGSLTGGPRSFEPTGSLLLQWAGPAPCKN